MERASAGLPVTRKLDGLVAAAFHIHYSMLWSEPAKGGHLDSFFLYMTESPPALHVIDDIDENKENMDPSTPSTSATPFAAERSHKKRKKKKLAILVIFY